MARMTAVGFVAALLFSLTTSPAASPEEIQAPQVVEIRASDVVLLEDPLGDGVRVLLSFPDLDSLAGRDVVSARLVLSHLETSETIAIEASPVTRAWSRVDVSWTRPWTQPGGDCDRLDRGSFRVRPDRDADQP